MADDYLTRSRRRAGYFGTDDTPQEIARNFGTMPLEKRANVLEELENGSDDSIDSTDMTAALDKRRYVELMRRTHDALRRQGR
ncbi:MULTISPECIES: hypothetical protein [unclassified Bradyrhizobium]|uniref:hypothetical protein n=1 Tax=unclassified Bradyrhizobium TaxID=2631580 RepID=UPI00247ADB49|nr:MULTISPECIES: hypothetical protein [unclassified Bradyrhizobium]WGR67840.1 hypothetical protein MTX24_20440 [Bradyrhizobium sp. ISRA426]WGR79893.1 hypothetical protein MTX21_05555 [Bradyrhizobium sp. ISRA430]WGR83079.1 hypothetical protein MTX25_20120 [Bradyrhizobium sp. ISRA432]